MRKFGRLMTILLLAGASASAQKEFVATQEESVRPDELIVKLKPGAHVSILTSLAPGLRSLAVGRHGNIHLLQLPPGLRMLLSRLIGSLREVEFVEPNRVRSVGVASPNDPGHSSQWALQTIRALQAWNYLPDRYLTAATAGANRVKIAVLDTGADCTHPDFKNSGGTSTDSANGGQLLFAGSQALVATTTPSPACSWQDDHGHGTHVAGTVAAATHNATGLASVGYPLQVVVYKVLDGNGEAADATIAAAIEAAADNGAQVISLSLAGTGYSQTLQTAIDYAWQRNSLVVAASGNTGGSQLVFPGAANHVVSVAATDSFNARASFSTYGNWVKIAAPGVSILSTLPTYANKMGALNYGYLSGTSMATPHVAAVAGLVYMANPGISAAAVAQRLQRSALSTAAGWNQFTGYGVLNAAGAVTGQLRVSAAQGSFTGQVVDADGLPLTGAVVTAGGRVFTTAPDGLFRLANLAAGSFTVTATASGFAPVNLQSAIVAGADTMLTLQMGVPAGQFSGSVAHNGSAVPGAVVQALSGGLIQAVAVTDQAGLYSLQVPPGTYELSASAAGYLTAAVPGQTIGAGASATVNLAIAQYGRIAGMALDSSGSPVAGAHISITGTNFSGGTVSDSDGNFISLGLPPGNYTVTASASGYPNSAPVSVTVAVDTTTVATPQFATTIPALIGHWRFDEGSGTAAGDASGSGWNATISGAVWAAGKFNGALAFNGTSAYVATPTIPLPTMFSISAWVNPSVLTQTGHGRIVETRFNSGFFLGINAGGTKYKFIVRDGAGSTAGCGAAFGCVEGGTIAAGWHFLTGTYDGTTARLFVDGVLVATDTANLPSAASYPMVIGRFYGGNGYGWKGAIDDVRLFNRALTSTDVSNLFNAAGSPAASLSPASLTFGSQAVGTTSSSQSVTLTNTGTAPLAISSIAITGSHAAEFAQTNNCGSSLAASANCSISVTFSPSAAGARSASLSITDNAAGSPHSVPLAGTGAGSPSVGLSPASLTFGSQAVGTTSSSQSVTLTNTGTTPLAISSIAVTGSHAAEFAQTNNCGSSLAASANCSISVTFSPSAAGARSASLSITDNAAGSPHSVPLAGTGAGSPSVGLSPASLTFGSQAVGTTSSSQSVTLTNTGTAPLAISSIAVTGSHAAEFAQTNNCGSSLAASANCSISVTFSPSAAGSRSASLSITDNAAGSPHSVPLAGTGAAAGAPSVGLSPASLTFGSQAVGTTSSSQSVTLTNTGTAPLSISSVAITGSHAADFNQTNNCGSSLAASANCSISVTFSPSSAGSRSASLSITDSAAGSPHSVPLGGAATVAGLAGYWAFDEGTGVTAVDTSGNGRNASVPGATWTAGKINGGLSFGAGKYAVTPAIPLSNTFTISVWVNAAALTQTGYARIAETQYSSGFYLGVNASGNKFKFIVKGGAGTTGGCGAVYGCVESGAITAGWHLLTGTYDGTTARLYVDGVLAASDTAAAPANTNLPLYLGRFYGGNSYYWNGAMDDVRLYTTALTAGEVSALFTAGNPVP